MCEILVTYATNVHTLKLCSICQLPVDGPRNSRKRGHRVMLQNHGDSSCLADRGGKNCLLQLYPQGTGFLLDPQRSPLWFNAGVN